MADKVKLHRRIANRARWEYQQTGAELASQVNRLKQLQKQCERLIGEIEALNKEQLNLLTRGAVDVQSWEGASNLGSELGEALLEWQTAVDEQHSRVVHCRRDLANARQKQRKSEDKHHEVVLEQHLVEVAREATELEGIYIGNFGRSK